MCRNAAGEFSENMRKTFHEVGSFLKRQISQIREEGWCVVYQKVRKLWKLMWLELLAPPAVFLKMDWPEAYHFVGRGLARKYAKLLLRFNVDSISNKQLENIENKAIFCLEKYISHKPDLTEMLDWVQVNRLVCEWLCATDKYEKRIRIRQRVADVTRCLAKEHQLEDLDIEFIPRSIAEGSIGVYENIAVYVQAGILGLRPPKKLILLLDPKSPVNNRCYLNYWRHYITIISDPKLIQLLSPLEKCLTTRIDFLMLFHQKTMISHRTYGMVREKWIAEKHPPILKLSNEDYERGWHCLKSLGVPEGAWFVCLHARESGWHEDRNSSSERFRDTDINTYSLAIKAIVDAGGWVIRIGDPSMTPLPKMHHVIDYAHSSAKTDWMDVFLCAQCRFFIGTSSGMFSLAMAFGVPLVMTNFLHGQAIYYFSSKDIFIPRTCWSKNENRTLSFSELISPPIGMFATQFYYEKFGLEVIDNTPEEIRDVVQEMLARFNGSFAYADEDENLQKRFRAMIETCSESYGDKEVVNARIGRDFLRKYASLLPAELGLYEKRTRYQSVFF